MTAIDTLRAALATVRNADPAAVKSIDYEEAERAKAAAAEAKRSADVAAKLQKALPDRQAALVADYRAQQEAALQDAAATLARAQLSRELGIVPTAVIARSPVAPRLSPRLVEGASARIFGSSPIGWDRAGRSADQLRSDTARDAAAALAAEHPDPRVLAHAEAEQAAEDRRAEMEAARRKRIEERKAAARLSGALPK